MASDSTRDKRWYAHETVRGLVDWRDARIQDLEGRVASLRNALQGLYDSVREGNVARAMDHAHDHLAISDVPPAAPAMPQPVDRE